MELSVGDTVLLPFDGEGAIVEYKENLIWGCPYKHDINNIIMQKFSEFIDSYQK